MEYTDWITGGITDRIYRKWFETASFFREKLVKRLKKYNVKTIIIHENSMRASSYALANDIFSKETWKFLFNEKGLLLIWPCLVSMAEIEACDANPSWKEREVVYQQAMHRRRTTEYYLPSNFGSNNLRWGFFMLEENWSSFYQCGKMLDASCVTERLSMVFIV